MTYKPIDNKTSFFFVVVIVGRSVVVSLYIPHPANALETNSMLRAACIFLCFSIFLKWEKTDRKLVWNVKACDACHLFTVILLFHICILCGSLEDCVTKYQIHFSLMHHLIGVGVV